jgi:hypothetical protein
VRHRPEAVRVGRKHGPGRIGQRDQQRAAHLRQRGWPRIAVAHQAVVNVPRLCAAIVTGPRAASIARSSARHQPLRNAWFQSGIATRTKRASARSQRLCQCSGPELA